MLRHFQLMESPLDVNVGEENYLKGRVAIYFFYTALFAFCCMHP